MGEKGEYVMIIFDTEKMKETYVQMMELLHEIRVNMGRIEQLVHETEGDWQGNAEKVFAQKLLFVKEKFVPVYHFWEEYAGWLKEQAEQYEEHESEIHSKLNLV